MKQSEDTINDGEADANVSADKDEEVIDSLEESYEGAEPDTSNDANNKRDTVAEDNGGVGAAPGDGGEFEDADESVPNPTDKKRDRPEGEIEGANGEPEASRQRMDDPRQPELHMPMQAQLAVPAVGGANGGGVPQMAQQTNGMPPQLGFDPNTMAGRAPPGAIAGANPLFGQNASLREMQLAQLGMGGGLPENAMMSQHLLNQQLLMGGQGQLPLGFGGNPAALGQFGMAPFNGQFPGGAAPGAFPVQGAPVAPGQEGGQQANDSTGAAPAHAGAPGAMGIMAPGMAPGAMTPGQGGPGAAMGFGGFGGRTGIMPGMAFGGMPGGGMPGGMPDAAFQQMMFQRGGLTEADAMRQRMMLAGIPPGTGGGFRPSFLAAAGGRLNNMSAELRGLASMQPQTPAVSLSLACDDEHLSEYQIMVRKQLEVFEAQPEDVESNTQGRKKQVSLGQVGIRCKHCAALPLRQRGRGAVYYPAKLQGVYQAAQNMASSHLCESCQCIDDPLKGELKTLRERRDTASGGKQYWADGARALGLFEAQDGLRLTREQQQQ